jgi:hypothetical protein
VDSDISNREAFAIQNGYQPDDKCDGKLNGRKDANPYWRIYRTLAEKGIDVNGISYFESYMMHYDICVNSIIESARMTMGYIEGNSFLSVNEENGKREDFSRKSIENALDNIDYIPCLEDVIDIIEFTKKVNDELKK